MLDKIFKNHRTVGLVGGINSGKSSLAYAELIKLKEKYDVQVYILGAEENIQPYLKTKGIKIILSTADLLDLKIKNSVIFIDEFADIFDVSSRGKQFERIKKFFNRLAHLNDYLLISTAQQNFWNKFMCGLISAFLVKSVEFDSLVNGTRLKEKIKSLEKTSDYRLELKKCDYYVIDDLELVQKHRFNYDKELDSKKEQKKLFNMDNLKEKKRNKKENKKR